MTVAAGPTPTPRLPPEEVARNTLLRRIDWRFFLPTPLVGSTVHAGADRQLVAGLGLISERVASLGGHAGAPADLAVLVEPDQATLRSAWSSLRPGGVCYVEWRSPWRGGSRHARRRLKAAGFVDAVCYWAWPPPSRGAPRVWVPTDATAARTHFLATRPIRAGLTGAIRRTAQQLGWRLAYHAGLLASVCALASKPAAHPTPPWDGINVDLARQLQASWADHWATGAEPRRLSWMLLTGGSASFNKAVGLVFADGEARPRVALKLARTATSDSGLDAEARALATLAIERPALTGVPRLLFCRRFAGGLGLAETVVRGRPLVDWLTPASLPRLALAATDWFSELAARPPPQPRSEWWPRLVEPSLAGFDGLPGPPVVPDLVARTRRLFASLGELPLTISHGDAGPLNVLFDRELGISVIDWEDCEPLGLPVGDLIALLTYLVFHLEDPWRTGRFREVYRSLLDPASRYGQLRAECLARYMDRVGVQPIALGPLALMPWMQRSLREHRGMLDATLGSEGREAFRRGLYVSLWEEELRSAERP